MGEKRKLLFIVECQVLNGEEMMVLEIHQLATIIIIIQTKNINEC